MLLLEELQLSHSSHSSTRSLGMIVGWTLCFYFIFTNVTNSEQNSQEVAESVFDQEPFKKEPKCEGVEDDDIICVNDRLLLNHLKYCY